MANEDIEQRVAWLERRLALLEEQLLQRQAMEAQAEVPFASAATQAPSTEASESQARVMPMVTDAVPQDVATIIAGEPEGSTHPMPPALPVMPVAAMPEQPLPATPVMPPSPLHYPPKPPRPSPARSGLEQAIGLKWAGWIGAIVLVLGGALGVKYAYDQGWLGGVPPAVRLAMASLAGVALLAVGEYVFRRINVIASAGFFGAGVAIFFVVSYAGDAFYGLYDRDSAFVLMALSTLIGAGVAMRGNLVSIAVLSLIGGNVAPLALGSDHPNIPIFLCYLLMLQFAALILAWRGTIVRTGTAAARGIVTPQGAVLARGTRGKWWTLRGFSLVTTSLWIFAILNDTADLPPRAVMLGFLTLFASLYHAELIASARKASGHVGRRGEIFAILVTAAFMMAVLSVLPYAHPALRAAWVLSACAATGALGLLMSRGNSDSQFKFLARSYLVQSAALLALAIPVMFNGVDIPIAWGVLALAMAAYGAIADNAAARPFAVAFWLLSLFGVLWLAMGFDLSEPFAVRSEHTANIWLSIGGRGIHDYTLAAWLLALIGHAIASLNARNAEPKSPGLSGATKAGREQSLIAITILADLVWTSAALTALNPLGATLALIVLAWLLAAADWIDARPRWAVHCMAILLAAAAKWALADSLGEFWAAPRAAAWAARRTLIFNPLLATGGLLAFSIVAEFWLARRRLWSTLSDWTGSPINARRGMIACAGLVIAIMAFGLSIEIERAVDLMIMRGATMAWPPAQLKQLAWTILWICAIGAYLGFALYVEVPQRHGAAVRNAAIIPLLLAGKFLLIDTLFFRLFDGAAPASVIANFQTIAALMVVAGLAMTWTVAGIPDAHGRRSAGLSFTAAVLAGLVLLWCGTLEIDRAYEKLAAVPGMANRAELAKQVAWSIFWSLFAIAAVGMGFKIRSSAVRIFGLALFGFTLLKVVTVDLSEVGRGYRILSFMVLGLLLLGTSVLYGKFTPKLLEKTPEVRS